MQQEAILVINPGSTSTKTALYSREGEIYVEKIDHTGSKSGNSISIRDELPERLMLVRKACESWLKDYRLVAIIGRGGLLKPLKSGIYEINDDMLDDLLECRYGTHASNLGAPIAYELAKIYGVPAYIVDQITIKEFVPEAYISGVPEIERKCRAHVLNIKECARHEAEKIGKNFRESSFVVAHLGGGISVGAMRNGDLIDVNNALLGTGPFSPERAGTLPIEGVLDMAMSGRYSKAELSMKFAKESGLKGYLGTSDMREVLRMIEGGNKEAELILRAMAYQISKEIGSMAAALNGKLDGIIITGGLANSDKFVDMISKSIKFLGDIFVCPGENELKGMAAGGFRAVNGEEDILVYKREYLD